jgi:hypothetical protein
MNGQGQKEELRPEHFFFGQGPKLIQMDIHAPADRADFSHSPVKLLLVPEGEAKLVPPGVVCLLSSDFHGLEGFDWVLAALAAGSARAWT